MLSTTIKVGCGVVEYSYNPTRDNHCVKFQRGCTRGFWVRIVATPGEAINLLREWRDENDDIATLIRWLSSQAKLPGYAQ